MKDSEDLYTALPDFGCNTDRHARQGMDPLVNSSMYNSPPPPNLASEHSSPNQMQYHGSPYSNYPSPSIVDSIPPGMDREAYIAGERSAMTRSLQMMLPSQQQLGILGSGLQRLEYMVSEEANRMRQVQAANVEISTIAQNLAERLDRIEGAQLPEIERRVEKALEAPLSHEFQATLLSLSSAVQQASKRQYLQNEPSTLTGFLIRQLSYLGSASILYAQSLLSKADIAALFLSRKILLEDKGLLRQTSDVSSTQSEVSAEKEGASELGFDQKLKSVSGATLFLIAVEIAWQMHNRAVRVVPKPFRRLTQPAQLGLRILRIATWVASFLMSAVLFRRGCHWIAHSSITKMTRVLDWCLSFKPFSSPKLHLPSKESQDDVFSQVPKTESTGSETQKTEQDESEKLEGKRKWHYSDVIKLHAHTQNQAFEDKPPLERVRSIFDTPPPSP